MSDHCESKRILVDIQDNGIIRRADTGYLIGNLSRDYPFSYLCHGTGEVESRSVQRREALQKGEKMPEFDKPEMPERIWAKDFPEAKQPTGKMGGLVEWTDTTQTEYLRADKVRELVRAYRAILHYPRSSSEWQQACDTVSGLIHDLFPEGLGG